MTERYTAAGMFRRTPEERLVGPIPNDVTSFCAEHWHRMPDQFHRDPRPRARGYLDRFPPSLDA